MKTSTVGKNIIKKYEGCKLKAYLCSGGKWTIGWGNTYYPSGKKVMEGDTITQERANEIFDASLVHYENIVNNHIKVTISQNQFDALVCHTYNTGGSDTLFVLINAKQPCMDFWVQHYITAKGIIQKGLIRRRWEEYNLFINVA